MDKVHHWALSKGASDVELNIYEFNKEANAFYQKLGYEMISRKMSKSLIEAGLTIEYLHEFPYAARAKFPFMEQGEDGWWRLPEPHHGTIPFLFSLQARKPA